MNYRKSYCEEKGISTLRLSNAQSTLHYIAENMRMSESISEDGYEHFQQAIKSLDLINEVKEELERQRRWLFKAGYNAYNIDIAFDTIKSLLKDVEVAE